MSSVLICLIVAVACGLLLIPCRRYLDRLSHETELWDDSIVVEVSFALIFAIGASTFVGFIEIMSMVFDK